MSVREITVDELAGLLSSGVPLVDVRQPEEYVAGHVPGAVLIPMAEVPARLEDLQRHQPLYLVCRTGSRSWSAAEFLGQHGIEAVNVAGGTVAWLGSGRDVVTGGEPS